MNALLEPAGLLYRGVNRLRRFLYAAGVFRQQRLPRPVISVGNIAAGGGGKTPAVIRIANFFAENGIKPAVLTRGYGRSGSTGELVTHSDAVRFGDEPVLIKQRTNADVIVGKNRYKNGLWYLAEKDCSVFLLDDGFQHLHLARDADVVIEPPRSRFAREGRVALKAADFVVPRRIRLTGTAGLRGKRVFAFAGLADNEQFFQSLRDEGLDLAGTRSFADHHRYTPHDVEEIRRAAAVARADAIVTTEKDAVKSGREGIHVIGAEFVIEDDVLQSLLRIVRNGKN